MKITLLALGMLLIPFVNGLTQTSDSIYYSKDFKTYTKNGKIISNEEMRTIVSQNPEAAKALTKSNGNKAVGITMVVVGTLVGLGGLGLHYAANSKSGYDKWGQKNPPDPGMESTALVLALSGIGLDIIGLIVWASGKSPDKKAIEIYNSGLKLTSCSPVKISITSNSDGLGFRIRF